MKSDDRLRTSVRLRIDQGIVLLRYGGVPSVACTLLDLSEGGCRCIAPLDTLDEQTAEAWQKILAPTRPLNVEVTSPPYLEHLPLDVEIRSATKVPGGALELGLRFHNADAGQRQLLSQAILQMATDKVRGAFSSQHSAQAAQYLVGGPSLPPSGARPAISAAPALASSSATPPAWPAVTPVPVTVQPSAASEDGLATGPEVISSAEAPETQDPALAPSAPVSPQTEDAPPPSQTEDLASRSQAEDLPPPSQAVDEVPPESTAEESLEPPSESAIQAATPSTPIPAGDPFRGRKVGEVLARMGKINAGQIQEAVQKAKLAGERLGRYLLREGLVTPAELCRALALQSGLPMTDLHDQEISEPLAQIFPYALMIRHEFIPFDQSAKMLCVAAANPLALSTLSDLERLSGKKIEVFLAEEDLVLNHVDRLQPKEKRQERKHMRYEIALPIAFQFCNRLGRSAEVAIHPGQTIDISEGGFLIEGPASQMGTPDALLRRGFCVQMTLTMDPLEVKGLCNLRFIKVQERPVHPDRPWQYGLQVLEMGSDDRRKLKEMCIQAGLRLAKLRATPPTLSSPNP